MRAAQPYHNNTFDQVSALRRGSKLATSVPCGSEIGTTWVCYQGLLPGSVLQGIF